MLNFIYRYSLSLLITIILLILLTDLFILPFITNRNKEIYVPDVKGIQLKIAKELLTDFNINIFYSKYKDGYIPGEIINISPRAFSKVKSGRDITLTIIAHKEDKMVEDFYKNTLRNTELYLDRNLMEIDTVIYEYSENINKNHIISQYPKPGQILNNSKMTLIVSLGMPPDYYIVPDLINLSLQRGKQLIINSGLRLGAVEYDYQPELLSHTILEQSMTPGMRVSFPASINLLISIDRKIKE